MVQVHFNNIKTIILQSLRKAEREIRIAVAWINDGDILDLLEEKIDTGLKVTIIAHDNDRNDSGLTELNREQAKVYLFNLDKGIMHHKFCVVDENLVLSGSYNWTWGAMHNLENIIEIEEDEKLIQQFIEEFDRIVPQHFARIEETINILDGFIEQLTALRDEIQQNNRLPEKVEAILEPFYEAEANQDKAMALQKTIELLRNEEKKPKYSNPSSRASWWRSTLHKSIRKSINSIYFNNRESTAAPADEVLVDLMIRDSLSLSYIDTIKGLDAFSYLKKLNISYFSWRNTINFDQFTLLEELTVNYSELSTLESIGNLTNLKKVSFFHNKLTGIKNLSTLSKLEELNLGHNHIVLLEGLEQLTSLKVLNLEKNALRGDPEEIWNLTNLEELHLSSANQYGSNVYKGISALKKLKKLSLRAGEGDVALLTEIVESLPRLVELKFDGTAPKGLAPSMEELNFEPNYSTYRRKGQEIKEITSFKRNKNT